MSDKKGKAKSQNLPRTRARKQRVNRVSMPGKSKKRSDMSVTAVNTRRQNPTSFSEGTIVHPTLGRGQRFVGMQMLTNVVTTASDSQMWTGTAPAATLSINQILLNPDTLNGRLAVFANTYGKFVFRKIRLEYEPLVATTQAGGGAIAIVNDPYVGNYETISYSATQEAVPSVTFPFRDRASLEYSYSGDNTYFTEYDASSSSTVRQTCQGVIIGFPSSGSLGATTMGLLRIHYVIDMFQPVSTLGISGLTTTQREKVKVFIAQLKCESKVEGKEAKEPLPLGRSYTVQSASASGANSGISGSVSSGFSAPKLDEQYVLIKKSS